MKKLRIRILILASWLAFFYIAVGRLDSFAISTTTSWFILGTVILGLVLPQFVKVPMVGMLLVPIGASILTKIWSGDLMTTQALLLALIEVCSIGITTYLALLVSNALVEFEDAVAGITIGPPEKNLVSAFSGLGSIYREVRRARNHHQPLGLISIGVDEKSIVPAGDKLVQEVQKSMLKQYKLHGLSKMLCDQLEDCAVVVQDSHHYLVVIPDTMPDEIQAVVQRLRQKANSQVGVEIKIGVASLPTDGYTFEGLLAKAQRVMDMDRELDSSPETEVFPLEVSAANDVSSQERKNR